MKLSAETNDLLELTCQENLCRQQLKCQARDFPYQKGCFHCGERKTYCIMPTPTHQTKQTVCCDADNHLFLICWTKNHWNFWGEMIPCFTDGSFTWTSHLRSTYVSNTWEKEATKRDLWMDFKDYTSVCIERCTAVYGWVSFSPPTYMEIIENKKQALLTRSDF